MKIALLCSGLGNVYRGHEIFARDLFELLKKDIDITLFKGGGEPLPNERVIDNIPRNSASLDHIHLAVSPKWESAIREQERIRVETETFAYASLKPLLEGGYDVIHCLEQEVCNILYSQRHLFEKTPKIVFSNGGVIPAHNLPNCDFVQEHTDHNLKQSAKGKSFMIPHGVDMKLFHPGVETNFRVEHGIPEDAFVIISVGTICYWHKRTDYVIREIAPIKDAYLVIVGQECGDTPEIIKLGKQLMGDRIVFTKMSHEDLPKAYAAANVFVLGSLFETFGIVYIEAMASGLPVISTNHVNQTSIVKEGVFIDMKTPGELTIAVNNLDPEKLAYLGKRGPEIVAENYDLTLLRQRYIERYSQISTFEPELPKYTLKTRAMSNLRNALKKSMEMIQR